MSGNIRPFLPSLPKPCQKYLSVRACIKELRVISLIRKLQSLTPKFSREKAEVIRRISVPTLLLESSHENDYVAQDKANKPYTADPSNPGPKREEAKANEGELIKSYIVNVKAHPYGTRVRNCKVVKVAFTFTR
eukprot:969627-Amorphochlora_amoeboformis.AAC.1